MNKLAILFDLDGTLIDSIGLLLECMDYTFEGRAHRPTRSQWTQGIGIPLRTQLKEWSADDAESEMLLNRYRDYQDLHLERMTSAYPGAVEILSWIRARGHAIGLVTSKGRGMTDRSLSRVGMETAFDAMITAETTVRHKPLPDPVWFALEQLHVAREHALFVGDSTHDMHSGRAAGVRTAAATWGPFSREELQPSLPDYWLVTFADLHPIIEQMEQAHAS